MTFYHEIATAERALERVQHAYLRRWGWKLTCETPGAFWLWQRDMSDWDAKFDAWHAEHPDRPRRPPSGIMTVPLDLAIRMTVACLDEQEELGDHDD